jgi:hypothetical protein
MVLDPRGRVLKDLHLRAPKKGPAEEQSLPRPSGASPVATVARCGVAGVIARPTTSPTDFGPARGSAR